MTGKDLFDSMNELDEALLDEALRVKKKKPALPRWGALAACCALVLLGGIAAWRGGLLCPAAREPVSLAAPGTTETATVPTLVTGSGPVSSFDNEPRTDAPVTLPASEPTELEPGPIPAPLPTEETPVTLPAILPPAETETEEPETEPREIETVPPYILTEPPEQSMDPEPGTAVEGVFLPRPEGETVTVCPPLPMISGYGDGSEACYKAPENGEVGWSVPLRGAVEEYGDGANYRVFVDLFKDGQPVPQDSDEAERERERLASLGYTVATETVRETDGAEFTYFTLHVFREKLEALDPGDYGYMLFLYNERVPGGEPSDTGAVVFNGNAAS